MLTKLHRFLNLARRIIPSKSTLAVLQSACINNNKIRVCDLEHTLVMDLMLKGCFLIPFKILKKIIGIKPLSVNISEGSIEYDQKKLIFETSEAEEFPSLPHEEFKQVAEWNPDTIKHIHSQKKFVSKDELKPALQFVEIIQEKELTCTSTNGHILRRLSSELRDHTSYRLYVTPKSLDILFMMKKKVSVFESDNWLKYISGDFTLYQRRCLEEYPDIESVIPTEFTGSVTVLTPHLKVLIKNALPFSLRKTQAGVLSVSDKRIQINCDDPENRTEWEGGCPTESIEGHGITMSLNLKYLESVLDGIKAKSVTLKYSTPITALVVLPINSEYWQELCLVMPVRMEDKNGK